jgi:hypothetical protein
MGMHSNDELIDPNNAVLWPSAIGFLYDMQPNQNAFL